MNLIQELLFVLKARDDASATVAGAKDNINAATDAVNKGADAADKSEKATSRWTKAKGAAGVAAKVFSGVVGSVMLGALGDAARAAAEDEANTARLAQTLENVGLASDDATAAIDRRIKAGQDLAFGDSQTRDSLNALIQATGDMDKALELNALAMDFARAKGIDLQTATSVLAKIQGGNVGIAERYGVVLGENATAQDALAAMQQKFSGQAATYGATTEAWTLKVKDAIGEQVEAIGSFLGPATGMIGLLPGLSSGFTLVSGAVGGLSSLIKMTAIPSLIAMAIPFAPILIAIAAIGAAVLLLKFAWENNWGDIQGKAKAVGDFLGPIFEGIGSAMANIGTILEALAPVFKSIWEGAVWVIKNAVNSMLGFVNTLIRAWNSLGFSIPSIDLPGGGSFGGFSLRVPQIPRIPLLDTGGTIRGPGLFRVGPGVTEVVRTDDGGGLDRPMVVHPIVIDGREIGRVIDDINDRRAGRGYGRRR